MKSIECEKSPIGKHRYQVDIDRNDNEHKCKYCGYVTLNSEVHLWAEDRWLGIIRYD